jgi:hypothetical protein
MNSAICGPRLAFIHFRLEGEMRKKILTFVRVSPAMVLFLVSML